MCEIWGVLYFYRLKRCLLAKLGQNCMSLRMVYTPMGAGMTDYNKYFLRRSALPSMVDNILSKHTKKLACVSY